MEEFIGWLNSELEHRGWSLNELARRAGVSSAAVSMVMSGQRKPGPEFCSAIATALKVAPEKVFRLSGLLPPRPERDTYYETLESLWEMLPDWKKKDIVLQARAVIEEQEREDIAKEGRCKAQELLESGS